MSVEYKKNGNGKCPVMHGGITKSGESNTSRLWPNSINLDILHQFYVSYDKYENCYSEQPKVESFNTKI